MFMIERSFIFKKNDVIVYEFDKSDFLFHPMSTNIINSHTFNHFANNRIPNNSPIYMHLMSSTCGFHQQTNRKSTFNNAPRISYVLYSITRIIGPRASTVIEIKVAKSCEYDI